MLLNARTAARVLLKALSSIPMMLNQDEPTARASRPLQREIPVRGVPEGLMAAERVLRRMGFRARRLGPDGNQSLYARRSRIRRLGALVFRDSVSHIWVVPVNDGRGRSALWITASPNHGDRGFAERFERLVEGIQQELGAKAAARTALAAAESN